MDETGLFYAYVPYQFPSLKHTDFRNRLPPDQGLSDKKCSGVKGQKVRLTYVFTSNTDVSEKLPPIIISKAKRPQVFQRRSGKQLNFYYWNNAKAWMTLVLYQEWIQEWDSELQVKNHKILLLQENFSSHIVPDGLQNICVKNFEPNLTAHVQPMDQGIIQCLKAHYCAKYIQCTIDCYEEGVTPSKTYDIDQLQAMQLVDVAWHEVDMTTIRNCWKKAAILPLASPIPAPDLSIPVSSLLNGDNTHGIEDPAAHAEKELTHALDELESTWVLQPSNRMDIEALLNLVDELQQVMEEMTDEEICQAMLDAKKCRKRD